MVNLGRRAYHRAVPGPSRAAPWLLDSRLSVTNKITELIARLEHKPAVLINASAIGYYGVRGDEGDYRSGARPTDISIASVPGMEVGRAGSRTI